MINKMAYAQGSKDALSKFAAPAVVTAFPKMRPAASGMHTVGGSVVPPTAVRPPVGGDATRVTGAPAAPAMKPPVMGGAAAPAVPAAKPGFMDSWKGQAAMQVGVPLAMMGVQNMMAPAAPKDPNALQ